jgi:hypothetical protein
MELLGDVGHVKSHFGPFGYCVSVGTFRDSANLDTRQMHNLCIMFHRLKNHFGAPNGTPR